VLKSTASSSNPWLPEAIRGAIDSSSRLLASEKRGYAVAAEKAQP